MSKFRVGDRVRIISGTNTGTRGELGTVVMDRATPGNDCFAFAYRVTHAYSQPRGELFNGSNLELVTTKEDKPMARRVFRLIKEMPTYKKGALLQEMCEDGTQPYECINGDEVKKASGDNRNWEIRDRSLVESQPTWFVEVFKVTPEYMTKEELAAFEAFKKAQKPVAKKRGRPAKKAK